MNQPQTTEILLLPQRVVFTKDFPGGTVERQYVQVPADLVAPERLDERLRGIEVGNVMFSAGGNSGVDAFSLVYSSLSNRFDKHGKPLEPLTPEQRLAVALRVKHRSDWTERNAMLEANGQPPQPWPFD